LQKQVAVMLVFVCLWFNSGNTFYVLPATDLTRHELTT